MDQEMDTHPIDKLLTDQPLIEFKNVSKKFGDKTILKNIDLKIYQGEITTIIGKSGTGKSVMLKHIIGLLEPNSGSICFGGRDVSEMNTRERMTYRSQMSYMFQNNALFDSMTVFENVAFPLKQTTRMKRKEINKRVMDKLGKTDLSDVAHRFPSELSGGMQKRVAFSRALITEPDIVLFDEPTTGQDLIRRNAILSMISEYKNRFGFTAVVVSHDLPDVLFISNRVLVLHEGSIVFQGTPTEFEDFDHPYVDEFVHSFEGFQKHMPGLYSKRSFKMRYKNVLNKKQEGESYIIAIFSISGFASLCEKIGHTTGQELVKELGMIISKHFDAVGGFSIRQRRSRFMTVLPFSNFNEARQIIDEFAKELRQNGFEYIKNNEVKAFSSKDDLYSITVVAGFAEGNAARDGISAILEKARKNLFEIGRFQCSAGRCYL